MHRNLFLVLLSFPILACDPLYRADIVNNSANGIEVVFQYDKKEMGLNAKRRISFVPDLIDANDKYSSIFVIDTMDYKVVALVSPFDTLIVDMGIGPYPQFDNITLIQINTSDTVILDSIDKILAAFDETSRFQYELVIK